MLEIAVSRYDLLGQGRYRSRNSGLAGPICISQAFKITTGHKNGVALGRGRVKRGGGDDRNGHSANPGLALKAIDTTPVLTQDAVGKRF